MVVVPMIAFTADSSASMEASWSTAGAESARCDGPPHAVASTAATSRTTPCLTGSHRCAQLAQQLDRLAAFVVVEPGQQLDDRVLRLTRGTGDAGADPPGPAAACHG